MIRRIVEDCFSKAARAHEVVLDLGGEVDFDDAVGDRFAHHVVGDARTAVQHQRRVGRRMDLR